MRDLPLVTFALFTYNQEAFIREAVAGALSQTYSPLQIIISDDHSNDSTFEIIQDLTKLYTGPHQLILNRNDKNLGIASHVNRVMEIARGELVVLAAGDDISMSHRTEVLVGHWLSFGRPSAICSRFQQISSIGEEFGDGDGWFDKFQAKSNENQLEILLRLIKEHVPSLVGCTEAWSSELFKLFGPLNDDVWSEDTAVSLRAWLLNGIQYVPEKLVKYRQHNNNVSNSIPPESIHLRDVEELERKSEIRLKRTIALLSMNQRDIHKAYSQGMLTFGEFTKLKYSISQRNQQLQFKYEWWRKSYSCRLLTVFKRIHSTTALQDLKWIVPRLVPFRLFAYIKLITLTRQLS
jgi:glycosyltransferase involved in cell wall biosynthesis